MYSFASAIRQRLLAIIGDWHYGRWLRFKHFQRLIPMLPIDLHGARILDAGCGEGAAALWLARRYPGSHLLGIDIDDDAIRACITAAGTGIDNVTFRTAGLDDLEYDRQFDFVYLIHVLEYLADDSDAVTRLSRSLRPGGLLLVEVVEPRLGGDPDFGFRRLMPRGRRHIDRLRVGYSYEQVQALLETAGLRMLGARYAMAPPALLAHTVFELLRERHFRWYLAILPLLRLIGYVDVLVPWTSGGSLMVWARRT